MAPMTNADSFLSLGGGGGGARGHCQALTRAGTAVCRRTSEDSADRSHGLWDYFHHGFDGNSDPDLHQCQQQKQRRQQHQHQHQHQQQQQQQQQEQQHQHKFQLQLQHQHQHQPHHRSPSPSSYLSLYLRPKSSRSQQTLSNVPQASPEQPGTMGAAARSAGSSCTWPLSIAKCHEKKGSSGSSKTTTTTTTTTAATTTTTTTMQNMRETLSSAGSATIVVAPPPLSPSTGSLGAEMTKQEFEALPEAIQRKVRRGFSCFVLVVLCFAFIGHISQTPPLRDLTCIWWFIELAFLLPSLFSYFYLFCFLLDIIFFLLSFFLFSLSAVSSAGPPHLRRSSKCDCRIAHVCWIVSAL
ncbi:hypothetical protein LY76DRAFT_285647 [Colletotrichum caudatum]|nr:hypothetical protein LY76DRAFT_285647 [Colletotrichum caudatum]